MLAMMRRFDSALVAAFGSEIRVRTLAVLANASGPLAAYRIARSEGSLSIRRIGRSVGSSQDG